MAKKKIVSIVDKVRQEVMKEFTRVPGEDYEEWLEFVEYEVNARLADIAEERARFFKQEKSL